VHTIEEIRVFFSLPPLKLNKNWHLYPQSTQLAATKWYLAREMQASGGLLGAMLYFFVVIFLSEAWFLFSSKCWMT
jgi:hypothetical protein